MGRVGPQYQDMKAHIQSCHKLDLTHNGKIVRSNPIDFSKTTPNPLDVNSLAYWRMIWWKLYKCPSTRGQLNGFDEPSESNSSKFLLYQYIYSNTHIICWFI